MRRRLLLVLLVFSFAAVAGFALPLLGSTAAERTQRFVLSRAAELDRFAAFAQQAANPEGVSVLEQEVRAHAQLYGEDVIVVDGAGRPVVTAGMGLADPGVSDAVDAALRNQPTDPQQRLWPWSQGPILVGRPVGVGSEAGGAVVLRAAPTAAAADIAMAWLAVLAGACVAAVAFAALAVLVAQWVLRPVAELSGGVSAVASGHPGAHVSRHSGPRELRALAVAFNQMSDVISASAAQQRRLVADTSHQLRNPLAALRLRVDTLEDHVAEGGRRAYDCTLAEVDWLESLLDDLLELARAESRATDLAAGAGDAESTDLATVVDERTEAWAPMAAAAGVHLRVEPGPAVHVGAAPGELAQVLDVLLDNAVKYAGPGATARVDWTARDGRIRLVVRDDGPGLPAQELPKATQRFWRSTPEDRRGSGLGLAIAERIVDARDGVLQLATAPGGGLSVTVDLPCPRS